MEIFFQLLIASAISGSAYGLCALSISLIYNATRVINFGQGDQIMLASMLGAILLGTMEWPVLPALMVIAAVMVLTGVAWDRLVYTPLFNRGASPISIGLGTLGLGIAVSGLVLVIFGPNEMFVPSLLPVEIISVGPLTATLSRAIVLPAFLILLLCVYVFLHHTMFGLAIRATGYNRDVSRLMGVSVKSVVLFTFILGALLSAVAGLLIGPLVGVTFSNGLFYTVKGFMAAIIGGIANPFAAAAGGLIIGILEAFVSFYINSLYGEPIVFALVLLLLLARPSGLLKEREG